MFTLAAFLISLADDPTVLAADQWRFPYTAAEARHGYETAVQHVNWMRSNRPWECNWIAEADWRRLCWDLLDDCRRIHPRDAAACRQKMVRLKHELGDDAFWLGQMPDPLPSDRFVAR